MAAGCEPEHVLHRRQQERDELRQRARIADRQRRLAELHHKHRDKVTAWLAGRTAGTAPLTDQEFLDLADFFDDYLREREDL
jgi:hypothetical protein